MLKKKTPTLKPDKKARLAYKLLVSKKAQEPVILDLRGLTFICDFFVICHGTSPAHTRGLVDNLLEGLKGKNIGCDAVEGYQEAGWVLVDCGDTVVHVFSEEQRDFYGLERLWGDAPRLP